MIVVHKNTYVEVESCDNTITVTQSANSYTFFSLSNNNMNVYFYPQIIENAFYGSRVAK